MHQHAHGRLFRIGGLLFCLSTITLVAENAAPLPPLAAPESPTFWQVTQQDSDSESWESATSFIDPVSAVNPVPLLFGMRSIAGTMTGSSIDAEDTLSFSSLQHIRPMIETVPLANAAEAYGRMMRNEVRFRIVLVTGQ